MARIGERKASANKLEKAVLKFSFFLRFLAKENDVDFTIQHDLLVFARHEPIERFVQSACYLL